MFQTDDLWADPHTTDVLRLLLERPDVHSFGVFEVPLNGAVFHVDIQSPKDIDGDEFWGRFVAFDTKFALAVVTAHSGKRAEISIQSPKVHQEKYVHHTVVEIIRATLSDSRDVHICVCDNGQRFADFQERIGEEDILSHQVVWSNCKTGSPAG